MIPLPAIDHYGYQDCGGYVDCPECFTLPDGGCAAGGHGAWDIPPYEPGSPLYSGEAA